MNFGISDNSCMFVTFYAKGTKTNEKNGHFYVLLTTLIYKIRLFKSHVSRFFSKLTVPLARMRGEQPFLYSNNSNFVDTMPKENNNLKPGDNSTLTSTQPSEKGKSQLQKLLQSALKKADEKEAENKQNYITNCSISPGTVISYSQHLKRIIPSINATGRRCTRLK